MMVMKENIENLFNDWIVKAVCHNCKVLRFFQN